MMSIALVKMCEIGYPVDLVWVWEGPSWMGCEVFWLDLSELGNGVGNQNVEQTKE